MLLDQAKYGTGLNYFYASRHGVDAAQGVYNESQEYEESNLLTRSGKFVAARVAYHGFNRLTGREKGPLKSVGGLFNHGFARTGKLGFNSAGASLSYLALGANWDPEGSALGNVAGMAVGHGLMMGASGIATSKIAKQIWKETGRAFHGKTKAGALDKLANQRSRIRKQMRKSNFSDFRHVDMYSERFMGTVYSGYKTKLPPTYNQISSLNKYNLGSGYKGVYIPNKAYNTTTKTISMGGFGTAKGDYGSPTIINAIKYNTKTMAPHSGYSPSVADVKFKPIVKGDPNFYSHGQSIPHTGYNRDYVNKNIPIKPYTTKPINYTINQTIASRYHDSVAAIKGGFSRAGKLLSPLKPIATNMIAGTAIAAGVTAIGIGAGFKAFHKVSTAIQNAKPMDFGSGFTGMNGEAVNERQRALQAMANSNLNVRSLLGQEAHSFRY